jgi:hypothetical protein
VRPLLREPEYWGKGRLPTDDLQADLADLVSELFYIEDPNPPANPAAALFIQLFDCVVGGAP